MNDDEEDAFVAQVVPVIRQLKSGRGRIIDAASEAMDLSLVGVWKPVSSGLPAEQAWHFLVADKHGNISSAYLVGTVFEGQLRHEDITHYAVVRAPRATTNETR